MKISYQWLQKYISITESPETIAELLTKSGLEVEKVESVESVKGGLKGLIVGEVLSCEKHPGADKLSKTTVNIGNGTVLPIVCGAANVAAGQKVVVATVGTTLYPIGAESFKINKAKIRGEVSEGMICAEDEIGLGKSHDGIMVLPSDTLVGTLASDYFNIQSDYIFEIGLTPNRADAASHLGVARDLKAILDRSISRANTDIFDDYKNNSSNFGIKVEVPEACNRYAAVLIKSVNIKPSPEWLSNALRSIGIAPINCIVDITNYIMHDLGQPMHAYDFDKIQGEKIHIRLANENEEFETLDSVNRKLTKDDLVVCDAIKPMCLAGVFGGKFSGINEGTTNILLEAAYFNPTVIRRTSQKHSLKTDSSFRFERGTDPNMVIPALEKATQLILEIAGGRVIEKQDIYPNTVNNFRLKTSYNKINQLIGKNIPKEFVDKTLKNLDINIISSNADSIDLEVPAYRVDVQREADIVEEILRIYGYDNISLDPNISLGYIAPLSEQNTDKTQKIIAELLTGKGFYEIITNSLTKSSYSSKLQITDTDVKILNPLSETLDVMRQEMVFSGLEVLQYNINRKQKDLKLYEFGKTYHLNDGTYKERRKLAIYITGNQNQESWKYPSQASNFFDLKDVCQSILVRLGIKNFKTTESNFTIYQSGIDASVGKQKILSMGNINSQILKFTDIKQDVFYAEIDMEAIEKYAFGKITFQEISKFPEVRRDLSLVLPNKVSFEQIENIIKSESSKLIERINLFDIYKGDKIEPNTKSYSVSIFLQDKEQTLTDDKIDKVMSKIMQKMESELGAVIRK